MQITYKRLLEGRESVGALLLLPTPLTARLAAQMARNIRKVNTAITDFDKGRDVLLAPYKDKEGKFDYEKLSDMEKYEVDTEYQELIATEIEIDIHPLKLDDLDALEKSRPGFEIPGEVFYLADFMFES